MRSPRSLGPLVLASLASLAALAGCGGAVASPPRAQPLVASGDQIDIAITGGAPGYCGGSGTAFYAIYGYQLDLATKSLTYQTVPACPKPGQTKAQLETKGITLTDAERDEVLALAQALAVETVARCGADAPDQRVTITHAGAPSKTYLVNDGQGDCHPGDVDLRSDEYTPFKAKLDALLAAAPQPLVSAGDTILVAISGGMPAPCDSTFIHVGTASSDYRLDFAAKTLTYHDVPACGGAAGTLGGVKNVTLSDADLGALFALANALKLETATLCGADAPDQRVTFIHDGVDRSYLVDANQNSCNPGDVELHAAEYGAFKAKLDALLP